VTRSYDPSVRHFMPATSPERGGPAGQKEKATFVCEGAWSMFHQSPLQVEGGMLTACGGQRGVVLYAVSGSATLPLSLRDIPLAREGDERSSPSRFMPAREHESATQNSPPSRARGEAGRRRRPAGGA
jgi:hypothetical protein